MARTLGALALAIALVGGAADAGPYRAPRTAAGQPDLQGYWTNVSLTGLERRPGVPLTFPDRAQEKAYADAAAAAWTHGDNAYGQLASEWAPLHPLARIDGHLRTSWIVDPPDGRVPYTPAARKRLAELNAAVDTAYDGPEARTPQDRCLVASGSNAGPPMLNHHSSSAYQIVQTAQAVVISVEKNHEVRVVRLGGVHPPASVRLWMGDSIGRWEGDTLVVETTNFRADEGFRNNYLIGPDATVVERFTRVSAKEIRYRFQVHDPATYTRDWAGEIPMLPEPGPFLEYACHEGNYGMTNILAGGRKVEADARAADGGR